MLAIEHLDQGGPTRLEESCDSHSGIRRRHSLIFAEPLS